MDNLINREEKIFFQTYKRLPIEIDHAKGARIYDKTGNSYLDFLGGIAVNTLGHCHPKTINAIETQIRNYSHVSNYFYQEPQIILAEKLKKLTGFERVFFTNSGTEATDGTMKLCRKWGNEKGKTNLIAFSGGFHGRTYGALSLMDKPLYKEGMGPYLAGCKILEYNNVDDLKNNIDNNTAAVFLEFLQGEGGIVSANEDFIFALKELKNKFNFLIVADEIQSGIGRTGKFLSFEYYDIQPDIVTLAKGIGGGLPLGAILGKESLNSVWQKGQHGTTYGGNAVACVAGLSVLDELNNGLLEQVKRVGDYLGKELQKVKEKYPDFILEIRGRGLMRGVLLTIEAASVVEKLVSKRVITNAASGKVLRLLPPLIITEDEVDEFVLALDQCLSEF